MFASLLRKEIAIRILLIAVILFNTFAFAPVLAQEPAPTASPTPSATETSTETPTPESTGTPTAAPTVSSLSTPAASAASLQQIDFSRLPLSFVANVGQFDKKVKFQTNSLGGSIFFTDSEVTLALMDRKVKSNQEDGSVTYKDNSKVVQIEYKNAENSVVDGLNLLPGVANFMVGSDKKNWVANAPTYDGIIYRNLYPGIDLIYEGAGHTLKSTFRVAAGAAPSLINWKYKYAGDIYIDPEGNLLVTLPAQKADQTDTTLIEHMPIAWQEQNGQRLNVPVSYTLAQNGEVSFTFPQGYNPSLPLIIDPTLTYSTYLGGIGTDVGNSITTDSAGNVYVTGYSYCSAFPLLNPLPGASGGELEVIITKINAGGNALRYSTCVGGAGDDSGVSIALDAQERIIVGGVTSSTNFPIVGGIATYGGTGGICGSSAPCQDTFILALNADGTAIRYSTYLGGNGRDELGDFVVDANGKVYIVGSTSSSNFPVVNAYDSTYASGGSGCSNSSPCYDVTVTKINPDLTGTSAILYSTYLGGVKADKGLGLALDASGKVYLTGFSDSTDFPIRNAAQVARSDYRDMIITVVDPSLSGNASLIYSTYFGAHGSEEGHAIALDSAGEVYLTGRTSSDEYHLRDPLQYTSHASSICGGSCYEAFVLKYDIPSNSPVYSTFLGGTYDDEGYGIAVDAYGRAYVTGFTRSSDFPVFNAIQGTKGTDGCASPPCADAFISVLEPDGQSFAYSTFLGGSQDDFGNGIRLAANNQVYLVGATYSTNFPTTPGVYDVSNTEANKRDVFISKISALTTVPPTPTTLHLDARILTGSDDAEQSASGTMYVTRGELEVARPATTRTVGLRYAGVNIPQGAVIVEAEVQFTPATSGVVATTLTIQAQASDNAPTFSTTTNNISSRTKTAASVSWTLPAWDNSEESGPKNRTPNLAAVIQEVINRPGWTSGNALAIIMSGTGERIVDSYEDNVYDASYLHIEYTLPTPTPTPTITLTPTPTRALPPELSCTDWRDGLPHGWIQSPWMNSQAQAAWDTNGMHGSASNSGTYQVGAYFQMPAGGAHKLILNGSRLDELTVAQGASAPTNTTPLTPVLTANPDGSYLITANYVEVKWTITAPVDLNATPIFQSFCYAAYNPTPLPFSSHIYTLNSDFDEGSSINLTHSVSDQLQLDDATQPFNFIWVAVSSKGTVVKIDTETGVILGEYWTSPLDQHKNPSRTTVDHNGNVWASNRNGNSVVHIGLVENGQCVDRNANGVIDTSTGLNDIKAWTNAGGADTNGGISTAQDECLLHYVLVSASGTRHVSVDINNNVWVSGNAANAGVFNLLNGATGATMRTEGPVGYGGYGGLIDENGVIWSARPLLRWDTANSLSGVNGGNWTGYNSHDSYGLCIDSQGNVWNTSLGGNLIYKFAPNGTLLGTFNHGNHYAQGCVVDQNDDVWVAHSLYEYTVGHLKNNGVFVGNVTVGSGPTGLAVDATGKIWSTNYNSGTVSRIDPNAGPIGADGVTKVGEVDFTSVNLGGNPYDYSDMTGSTLTGSPDNGTWAVVFDSALPGAEWGTVSWFSSVTGDGALTVTAASSEDGVNFGTAETAANGQDLSLPNGRYLKMTVSFQRASTGESPILYDLRVGTVGYMPPPTPIYTPTFIPSTPTDTLTPTPTPTGATHTPTNTSTPTNTPTQTPTGIPTTPPFSALEIPGWIGSPAQRSTVSGVVPITLASGITLQSGTLDYWPVENLNDVRTLAIGLGGKTGGETLGSLDTTTLPNGSYIIRLQGTNSSGVQQDSGIMITVSGEYKPGRVRFTITDLTIPVAGLPITIARTYDSLERNSVGDFGYGWSLAIGNPKLEADLAHNVTLTMPDGKRSTFYFTPQPYPQIFGYFMYPHYTPEAGVYGKLEAPDCLVVLSGGKYFCFLEDGEYSPAEYTYTDPYGRKFQIAADGTLKTITDLNNNVLTFTPNGITSSAGNINVPFVRDAQGRITQITYPAGKNYVYGYKDGNNVDTGELRSVTFPNVTLANNTQQAILLQYDYYADHFFKEVTDPRGKKPVFTTYDASNRIESVTDAAGNKTTYEYDLALRKTTIHYLGNPAITTDDLGDAILIYDTAGYLTNYTDPLDNETIYTYDTKHNLIKVRDPLTHEVQYQYNADGHPTKIIDPLNKTLGTVEYNQYGGPTILSTMQGGNATVQYDPVTFMPLSASDSLGSLGSYTWLPQDKGNPTTFTNQYGETTGYTYTPQGYVDTVTDPLGHKTHYAYDEFGRVTDMISAFTSPNNVPTLPESSTTHYEYDELGRMVESTVAFGTNKAATTKYEYDVNGNRTAVVDPLNRRTEYVYDNANRLTDETYAKNTPLESTTHYVYDIYSRLIDVKVALGTADESITHYEYYDNGLKKNVTIAYGSTTTNPSTTHYEYYDDGRVKDVVIAYNTADEAITHYVYDAAGRTVNVTIAFGTSDAAITRYDYYDSGLLKSTKTAYGTFFEAVTNYFYDARGRSTVTQYADGTTTSQSYDLTPSTAGWVNATTDQGGVTTKNVYDAAGRLDQLVTSAYDPQTQQTLQQTRSYDYDAANRMTDSFDALNNRTSFTYYPTGQMATSKAWKDATTGYTTTYDYNLGGEQISVLDANNHQTQYQYNERGLLKQTTYPGSVTTSQTYDFAGRLVTSTDENGIVTKSFYNAAGQLTSVTQAFGTTDATTIQYGYNFAGQMASMTDAKSHVTSFLYNDAGQRTKKTLPDLTYEQYFYNAAGNMTSERLADGNSNNFTYDNLNRLTQIAYFDQKFANFTYTTSGQRDTASTRTTLLAIPQVTDYDYDPFGRLKQVMVPDGRTVSYAYNNNDQRTSMTTPATTVYYDYNGLGQLTTVKVGSLTATPTAYEYDPVGFMTKKTLPNGVTTSYTPNVRDQLTNVTSRNSANTILQSFDYLLDNAGTRKKVTELGGSYITWDYDNLYRLTDEKRYASGASTPNWQASFHYDAAGNRDSQTINGTTTSYGFNALDQLTNAGAVTYGYNGRGDLTTITNGGNVTTYAYDAADRLTSVTAAGTTSTYTYNADGKRVKQTVGSAVTNYLWDEASAYGDVVFEYNSSGSTLASYVLGGTGLISQTRSSTTNYFLQDGQGSTRGLTSTTGTVTDTYSYTAFGESFATTGTTVNPYRYTGQQLDTVPGLYSLRARYYNPALGRFLSQDRYPVNLSNPVELNRYVYTGNSPINAMDPSGQFALETALTTNTVTRQNAAKAAWIGQITKSIYTGIVLGMLLLPVGVFVGDLIGLDALADDLVGNLLDDILAPADDTLIDIPAGDLVQPYALAKDEQDALDLITTAIAALAARGSSIQILIRGTNLSTAIAEQNDPTARYHRPYNRLWTFPNSPTALSQAAFYAVQNVLLSKTKETTGAITIWGMQKNIYNANLGGQESPIWNRFGLEAGIGPSMDPFLIGPEIIAIPLDVLKKMQRR